jgi:hypothetical protein
MTLTFIYLMVFLKLPILALLWIVWWAIHQNDDDTAEEDRRDGGRRVRRHHPRTPLPRSPRRGPHGCAAPPSPPRVRSVVSAARRGSGRF